jgi:hypothetical protein
MMNITNKLYEEWGKTKKQLPATVDICFISISFFLLDIFFIYISNAIQKVPCTPLPPLPYPFTPTSWPCHSSVLGHMKFVRPRGLSSQ